MPMPLYEYRCSSCGHQQEFLQKWSDAPVTGVTSCGKESFQKMLTAAGFQLKGSGWYATDFKNSGAKPATKTPAAKSDVKRDVKSEAKSEPKGESAGESKSESKSAGSKDAAPPAARAGRRPSGWGGGGGNPGGRASRARFVVGLFSWIP